VVGVVVPVKAREGVSLIGDPGAGLLTASVIAVDVPPPGDAFTALSDRMPVAATSDALSRTFICVELT
jgi:hypothetical protein